MEQFQERLARLAELTPEELDALEQEVVAAFDAADTAADLETMQALADALDSIRAEKATRGEAESPAEDAAPTEADVDEAPMAASAEGEDGGGEAEAADPEPEAKPEGEAEVEGSTEADAEPSTDDAEPEAEAEAEAEPTEVADAVPATNEESEETVDTQITAEDVPAENAPVAASAPMVTIRAGGDIPGVTAGTVLDGMDAVVDAMTKKVNSMRNVTGDGEHIIVASLRIEDEIPDERVLKAGDLNGNSKKIRSLISDKDALQPAALTAGGWCAPPSPIYDVPTVGSTARPIRDSLPSFTADRGGITWATPPALPDMGGLGLWRYSGTDWESFDTADASDNAAATKPCFTVECGADQSIDVDAITLCLNFDNMSTRAFPEWIRANTDLTLVAQSRFAEQVLLSRMFAVAATGTCGTPATSVGVARDFFLTVRIAAANKRWELRLDPDAPLQLLAPSWVADAIAVDLGLAGPGDSTYSTNRNAVDGFFREHNIDPVWFMDDVPTQAAFSACDAFPANAHWLLYPTGTFLRLDSGDLNIGVVRDQTHVQANTYSEFSETFETVAHMGPANAAWIVRGLTTVNIYGSAAALTDTIV